MKTKDLHTAFKNKGYVNFSIDQFFPEFAFFSDNFNSINDSEWSYIIKNRYGEHDFYLSENSMEEIEREKLLSFEDYNNGVFSFSFRRLPDNDRSGKITYFSAIKDIVGSEKFKSFLTSITGREIKKMALLYLNRFDKGDFLTTHCDPGESFGIVINLTGNWNPNHGGLTVILDKERKFIVDTLVPYNLTTLIFDTSEKEIPHFVSMVTAEGKKKRMALVVRYD